jgi:hypothetical protein
MHAQSLRRSHRLQVLGLSLLSLALGITLIALSARSTSIPAPTPSLPVTVARSSVPSDRPAAVKEEAALPVASPPVVAAKPSAEQESPPAPPPQVAAAPPPTPSEAESEPLPVNPVEQVAATRPFKRMKDRTDEELRLQLLKAPEVGLDFQTSMTLASMSRQQRQNRDLTPTFLMKRRPDLALLPFRMGDECHLGKEAADNLHTLSLKLRGCVQASTPNDGIEVRPDPDKLRTFLLNNPAPPIPPGTRTAFPPGRSRGAAEWLVPEAVPTLQQLLMAENKPVRMLLVELLAQIRGKEATVALAQRAVFDLAPEVREAAVQALAQRPLEQSRPTLLQAMRYAWSPAAEHAAEALIHLRDTAAVPALVDLLAEPDPKLPQHQKEGPGHKDLLLVREVVRVNHLSNCTLCHAVSADREDRVRGRVPSPGERISPSAGQGYGGETGTFVRADITYLRQDFSVHQPVENHGAWPKQQRYDYLLRTRTPTQGDLARLEHARLTHKKGLEPTYEQRDAVLFALRELTGKDLGPSWNAWLRLRLAAGERSQ